MPRALRVCFFVSLSASLLFALTSFTLSGGIASLACPLLLAFTAAASYTVLILFLRDRKARAAGALRRFYQYFAYILLAGFVIRRAGGSETPYALDVLQVILWTVVFVSGFFVLHKLKKPPASGNSQRSAPPLLHRVIREIGEWAEALVQAVLGVTLLNIFVGQLYQIPSESMVSAFLIADRVVVFKTPSGAKFPVSKVGIPRFRDYNRGDIVVFRNPHYQQDFANEFRYFLAQLVNLATFTKVNLNVDAGGEPKADPLVKRVTGVSGEQLMMQDGVLYARTAASADFIPVAADALWAEYDVASLPPDIRSKVRTIPLSKTQYNSMIAVEQERSSLNIETAAASASDLALRFAALHRDYRGSRIASLSTSAALFSDRELFVYDLFRRHDQITAKLLASPLGPEWFSSFLTKAVENKALHSNAYDAASARLNLMIKLVFAAVIVRDAQLISEEGNSAFWAADETLAELFAKAEPLNAYVFLQDRRNMSIFPPNAPDGSPRYIGAGHYFLMGDNRFNSLDMRHSYDETLVLLSSADPLSVRYYSNLSPQTVPASAILGTPVFRVWPPGRIGIPGKK